MVKLLSWHSAVEILRTESVREHLNLIHRSNTSCGGWTHFGQAGHGDYAYGIYQLVGSGLSNCGNQLSVGLYPLICRRKYCWVLRTRMLSVDALGLGVLPSASRQRSRGRLAVGAFLDL